MNTHTEKEKEQKQNQNKSNYKTQTPENESKSTFQFVDKRAIKQSVSEDTVVQRQIDYGSQEWNENSQMIIPAGTSLYHATKLDYITKIRDGINVNVSKTTQLGKGFYTSWFSAGMEDYGAYVIRFRLTRDIHGQQVYSDKIHDANQQEIALQGNDEAIKSVKGNWDNDNDFLYTPKLDEEVDGQKVPHQVKINANGVNALNNTTATVIETGSGVEKSIQEYKVQNRQGMLAAIRNNRKE